MLRALLSIAIGAVLALLLAAASQLLLAPFFGNSGWAALRVVAGVVFWGVLLLVIVAVLRDRRSTAGRN